MPQVIQESNVGGRLGQAFGGGLQGALGLLAQQKMADITQQRQLAQQLKMRQLEQEEARKAVGNLPEEIQNLYVYGDKNIRKELFRALSDEGLLSLLMGEEPEQQQTAEQAGPSAMDVLKGVGEKQISQMSPHELLQMVTQPQQSLQGLQAVTSMLAPELMNKQQAAPGLLEGMAPQAPVEMPEIAAPAKAENIKPISSQMAARQRIREALGKPLGKKHKEALKAEQDRIDKDTQAFFDKTSAEYDAAKDAIPRLETLEKLINRGKLPPAALHNFLEKLGEISPTEGAIAGGALGHFGPIGALAGGVLGALASPVASLLKDAEKGLYPDLEEFQKKTTEFVNGAKAIFGARITDNDLKVFLSMIPTLGNTDSGKKAIINNMKLFNEGAEIKYHAMQKIIRENGGKRPQNLRELVDQATKKDLDKIAKKWDSFKEEQDKLMSKAQSEAPSGLNQHIQNLFFRRSL